jgi:hypothetical protein
MWYRISSGILRRSVGLGREVTVARNIQYAFGEYDGSAGYKEVPISGFK